MDDHIAGAYGFAALSLQIAVLNALVMKGVFTTTEVAEITALAAESVAQAKDAGSTPEVNTIAHQCLAGIAESWGKRGQN